jgi:hypothetical protein
MWKNRRREEGKKERERKGVIKANVATQIPECAWVCVLRPVPCGGPREDTTNTGGSVGGGHAAMHNRLPPLSTPSTDDKPSSPISCQIRYRRCSNVVQRRR